MSAEAQDEVIEPSTAEGSVESVPAEIHPATAEVLSEILPAADDSQQQAEAASVVATPLDPDSSTGGSTSGDTDSGIASWRSSRTQSVTSSVNEFRYEHGRRYHSYQTGTYHLPNDDEEQDRLDLQHHIFRIALDGHLYLAPLPKESLHDVLDVGCGTGIWCIEVADSVPHAQVVGFDLSPIQPEMVPPNCRFLVDDCNSAWLFSQKFDLIHTRAMVAGIKDWPRYLQQAFENLKPGGYIELHELHLPVQCIDAPGEQKPYLVQWGDGVLEGGAKIGLDFSAGAKLNTMLQDAGFTDITIRWQNWPVGPWAKGAKNKEIGRWWATDLIDGTRNTSAMFTRLLGWTLDEFEVFAAKIASEIREKKKHMYAEVCFAYAQKPTETTAFA